ncbi:unnamed protein product [Mytilus coruscus]|uniref:Ig-like domain-containing protein n=1 Tax=Mytilus coruscus TaxID=42192 RepID=A0A6J8DH98_MYTCO|nr:unnamed protein product [Mytilus coruscus]
MERQYKQHHLIYLIRLVIFLGGVFQIASVSTVVWNITSDPVIFGESVTLKCYVQFGTCNKMEWRKWSGGIYNMLICLNGQSYFKDKYKMKLSNKSQDYELEILHFDESDVGCNYTCSCGFDLYTHKLMLKNYIYYPKTYFVSDAQVNIDMLTGIITMRNVFPIPRCVVRYGNINQYMIFATISRFDFTYTYDEISTRYKFNVKKARCAIYVTIKCSLGPKIFEVTKKVPDVTSYCEEPTEITLPIVIVIIGLLVILPILLATLWIKCLVKEDEDYCIVHCCIVH